MDMPKDVRRELQWFLRQIRRFGIEISLLEVVKLDEVSKQISDFQCWLKKFCQSNNVDPKKLEAVKTIAMRAFLSDAMAEIVWSKTRKNPQTAKGMMIAVADIRREQLVRYAKMLLEFRRN